MYGYLDWTRAKSIITVEISDTVGLVTVIVSFLLIDRRGRRKLDIFGYSGVASALAIMLAGAHEYNIHAIYLSAPLIFAVRNTFPCNFQDKGRWG